MPPDDGPVFWWVLVPAPLPCQLLLLRLGSDAREGLSHPAAWSSAFMDK